MLSWFAVQSAERRLNAQMQTAELDDALESLGAGQAMHSSVRATVRGAARQGATGSEHTKDKADRATYQTVLDPRTRLVRCLPPLLMLLRDTFLMALHIALIQMPPAAGSCLRHQGLHG